MNLWVKKTVLSAVGLIGVTLAGAVTMDVGLQARQTPATAARGDAPPKEKKRQQAAGEKAKPTAHERIITGKVFGPDGKPLAAELSLLRLEGEPESLGRTNADGTFRVRVPLKAPGAWLIAKADRYGLDFMMPATNTPAEVTFRLPTDHPVRGRLIDPQGKPVAGATVTAHSIGVYDDDQSMDRHLKQWTTELYDRGVPPDDDRSMGFGIRETPDGRASRSPLVVKSDADGQFEFTGIGERRQVVLKIRGPGIADKEFVLVNRPGFDPKPHNDAAKANVMRGYTFGGHWQLYGPDTGVVVEPEKVIRGTVTDRETGHRGTPALVDRRSVAETGEQRKELTEDALGPEGPYIGQVFRTREPCGPRGHSP